MTKNQVNYQTADISENELLSRYPTIFEILLIDRSRSRWYKSQMGVEESAQGAWSSTKHIIWATESYAEASMGGHQFGDEIKIEHVTGVYGRLIQPRAVKTKEQQQERTKQRAEVFTPAWLCNLQNNIIDEEWFGCANVFNVVDEETHTWKPKSRIVLPADKRWQDYVKSVRWEITCGEAPYLVSRYDTTTGELIGDLDKRIGLLDRKLRLVSKRTKTQADWYYWAEQAYKSIYAYEWQGDNLLLAREALLLTYCEYFEHKFGKSPEQDRLEQIATIISWNVFQMDGLRGVIPETCGRQIKTIGDESSILFSPQEMEQKEEWEDCPGCVASDNGKLIEHIAHHNGIPCYIIDWEDNAKELKFIDLLS